VGTITIVSPMGGGEGLGKTVGRGYILNYVLKSVL